MCSVSMVMDHYRDKWWDRLHPDVLPVTPTAPLPDSVPYPSPLPDSVPFIPWPWVSPYPPQPAITPEELAEFRKLLERAREYDRKMGQPDCELDEKRQALKKVAKELGVEIEFV